MQVYWYSIGIMSLNKFSKRHNPYKPKRNFKDYLKFLVIAALLVVFIEFVVFRDGRPYLKVFQSQYEQEIQAIEEALPPKVVYPDDGAAYFEAPKEILQLSDTQSILPERSLKFDEDVQSHMSEIKTQNAEPVPEKKHSKSQVKTALKVEKPKVKKAPVPKFTGKTAYIAIVIDDVGMNVTQSRASIDLPKEVTLAMLPYAPKVREMAQSARAKGHELIIHTPMEAMNKDAPLGSIALRTGMNDTEFKAEFNKMTASFDGYVGINNHMGSRLTQDNAAMQVVMKELKKRGLYFLDSKTINTSVAADWAQKSNIPFAVRDVFLDHEETPEFVNGALLKAERHARKYGSAIAIGHPKEVTMSALRAWIPTLEAKNIKLVPVSKLLRNRGTSMRKASVEVAPKKPKIIAPVKAEISEVQPLKDDEKIARNPKLSSKLIQDFVREVPNSNLKIQMVKESAKIINPSNTKPKISYPEN